MWRQRALCCGGSERPTTAASEDKLTALRRAICPQDESQGKEHGQQWLRQQLEKASQSCSQGPLPASAKTMTPTWQIAHSVPSGRTDTPTGRQAAEREGMKGGRGDGMGWECVLHQS